MIAPHINKELELVLTGKKVIGSVPMRIIDYGLICAADQVETFIRDNRVYFILREKTKEYSKKQIEEILK